jgi:PAS domain S-box-containing protein
MTRGGRAEPATKPGAASGRAAGLAAIVVGFLLVTLVAGDLFVRRQQRFLQREALALAAGVCDFRVAQISRWLAERRGDARVASRDPIIARAVRHPEDPGAQEAGARRLQLIASSYGYKSLIAVDREGSRRLSVGTDTALDADTPGLLISAQQTGKVLFSSFRRATGAPGLTFDTVVPLVSEESGKPEIFGGLVLRFDPTDPLIQLLGTQEAAGHLVAGELMLLERNGGRDLYIYPYLRRRGEPWLFDGPRAPGEAEALVAGGRTDFNGVLDARGLPMLAGAAPLPETTAMVVGTIRTDQLMGESRRGSWFMVGLLAASLLSVALLVLRRANLKAGRALRASGEKFKSIFENMQESYVLSDAAGTISLVNPAAVRMLGYPNETALLGKSMERDIFADPAERVALKAKLAANGQTSAHKATFKRADGGSLIVEGNVRLVLDADGTFAGIEGVLRDMSAHYQNQAELIEAREAAMAATRAKSEFLANMSHEIRTPLNAIVGLGHLLQRSELPPRQREYVDKIQASSQMLLQAVNDVLDVSKIEANKLELEQTPFDLGALLDSVSDVLTVPARDKGLSLRLEVDRDVPPRLLGDPIRLGQVITNLAGNGVKFTERGVVTVGVENAGPADHPGGPAVSLRFFVRDTGIGIASAQKERIFEPFTQADGSTTRRFGGTGLGLTICRQLVEMMGGKLEVESAPGVGSTFSFTVSFLLQLQPVAEGAPDAAGEPSSFTALRSLRGLRVLVAEDNAINQEVARELLEAAGMTVVIADNGRQAVDAATSPGARFDAILMDLQMPEMDGIEATGKIRAHAIASGVPIIAMTAHALPSERDRCLAGGMNDHVPKPIEPAKLYTALAHWVKAPEGVPDLPGVDVSGALGRLGGDQALYHRLLANLLREWDDALTALEGALGGGDPAAVRRVAHTLKGTSATLGVLPLASEAAALEKATVEGDRAAVASAVRGMRDRTAGFIAVLAPRLRPAPQAPRAEPGVEDGLEAALAELGDLLGRRNLRARDALARLRGIPLPPRCQASLEQVAIDVERLDYASAGRALEDLVQRLQPGSEAAS